MMAVSLNAQNTEFTVTFIILLLLYKKLACRLSGILITVILTRDAHHFFRRL